MGVIFGGTDNSNTPLYGVKPPPQTGNPSGGNSSQGVKVGTFTIKDPAGPLSANVARQWTNQQIPYENIAGNSADRDEKFVRSVQSYKRIYQEKTIGLRKKWRYINHMLRGNSTSKIPGLPEIHVPELYKRLETACTRIHEAIKSYSDWFKVRGREPMDETEAQLIQEFIRWQLTEADVDSLDLSGIRSLFTYQVCVAKVQWDRRIESRPKTSVEEIPLLSLIHI